MKKYSLFVLCVIFLQIGNLQAQSYRIEAFFSLADSLNVGVENREAIPKALVENTLAKHLKTYTLDGINKRKKIKFSTFQRLRTIDSPPFYREAKQLRSIPDAQLTGQTDEMGELLAYYAPSDLQTFYWQEEVKPDQLLLKHTPTYIGLYLPAALLPQGFDKPLGIYTFKKADRVLEKQNISLEAMRRQVKAYQWVRFEDEKGNSIEWSWNSDRLMEETVSGNMTAQEQHEMRRMMRYWIGRYDK